MGDKSKEEFENKENEALRGPDAEKGKRKPYFKRELSSISSREIAKDRRRYNLGICLFSVLNVLLISLIIITGYYVFSEKKVIVLRDADICVPCEDLRLHPDDKIEGIERRGENKTVCCMKEEEGSDALVGYFIDHWLKKKLATDDRQFIRYECNDKDKTTSQKPIIKLVGKTEKQKAEHHKLHWDGDSEMAIKSENGELTHHKQHGFIEIKKSGLYQVYSQIVLDHDMKSQSQHNAPAIYQHSVVLIEAGTMHDKYAREKIILKTSNSHCASKSNRQTITSYLGGAFQLSEGDKLAVKAHNKTELVPVPHMNFFGVHML
ncbi:uncharacterized protein LOC123554521 [Mercenaria mercenaria]|uniref:uncharacterized protein LOC123554521 n=1 Tax=Mercenaria mercenaria TaxID=6596 RepID=UPI00234F54CF|nr:uncharacterized protein LOC123554521 [Mercenaria mercenaria]